MRFSWKEEKKLQANRIGKAILFIEFFYGRIMKSDDFFHGDILRCMAQISIINSVSYKNYDVTSFEVLLLSNK